MKLRTLAVLIVVLVIAALCCAGCLQELPLGDKYINEAAGFLRVQNTSTDASYIITAVELRNSAGEIIKTWDGLALEKGDTWTGDVDLEGSFTLYCTVRNDDEDAAGRYEYGTVAIKLHEVTDSKIIGEAFFSDADQDGFSDSWEKAHEDEGFNPADPGDGGTVYVSTTGSDDNLGTQSSPYKSLSRGLWKAKYGLTKEARIVMALGVFTRGTEDPGGSDTSMIHITDTGPRGVTIIGDGPTPTINAETPGGNTGNKRAIYLGPGTKLILENITIEKGSAYRGAGIHADGAELILGDGVWIRNCAPDAGTSSGGGVYASGGALVVMKSGSLIGDDNVNDLSDLSNSGWMGVGVALLDGSGLTMENGSRISGNRFIGGGAVHANLGSWIIMKGGAEISNNIDYSETNQITNHGGGVRLDRGSRLLMEGGLIEGNVVSKGGAGGGGVYVGPESVFEMQDGTIRGNKVKQSGTPLSSIGNGGGVYVDSGGIFNMTGGEIASNTASGQGGGVYLDGGSFAMTGGTVYGSSGGDSEKNTAGLGGHAYANPPQTVNDTLSGSFTSY
jgi:hypothetical protein